MKNIKRIFFLLILITGSSFSQTKTNDKEAIYTCVMHPEIQQSKAGNCPKCGMTLVLQKKEKTPKKPSSKMEMTEKKAKFAPDSEIKNSQTKAVIYTCVMHPEIQQSKAGKCPKCGLELVIQKKEKSPIKHQHKTDTSEKTDKPNPISDIKNNQTQRAIPVITTNEKKDRLVRYDLYVRDTIVTFGKKKKRAIAVNGQIPMPTITFTQGDIAEIVVHNELKESTGLHWHGLMLPNEYDGVPYLTQMPIKAGKTFTYKFKIVQHGTHWYHSHMGFQEQIGMYGSMILKKRDGDNTFRKGIDDLPTLPIVLSEWSDLNPNNANRMLHFGNDYPAIKKGSTQSYAEAIAQGHFGTKLLNDWKRMKPMDVGDLYYNKFLINGNNASNFGNFKAGEKVRLRVSNGGGSSYFWMTYAGGKITVVANDGNDVQPIEVDRLLIGVSETYDIVLTIPENGKSYEFLATPEDRSGYASLFLSDGEIVLAEKLPRLDYFAGMKMMNDMMDMSGNMKDMGMNMSMQKMDMNTVMYREIENKMNNMDHSMMKMDGMKDHEKEMKEMDHSKMEMDHSKMKMEDSDMKMNPSKMDMKSGITTLNYAMLKATEKTNLSKNAPKRELYFDLNGNMNRYVWSMDNKVLSEVDKILIKKGEILRITLTNQSMMRHPMHLHGHDFRLLNGQGDYAPMKNVMDIMPMETNSFEFEANADGDWFFHCHILYHMMSGMNRVLSYENSAPNPFLPNKEKAYNMLQMESNIPYFTIQNNFATNSNDGMLAIENARWSLSSEWRLGYNDKNGYESETHLGRYIGKNQFFMPFIGFDARYRKLDFMEVEKNLFGQTTTKDKRLQASLGFVYTLPFWINFQTEVYHDGNVRMQLSRNDIPLSKRLRMDIMGNSDREFATGLKYILDKNFGITAHYDSDMGFGVGINAMY
ncbi:MAG: CopA family copper-resistance protein [Flavobacterium sp.]|jgi:CopA family copper-resistance protein